MTQGAYAIALHDRDFAIKERFAVNDSGKRQQLAGGMVRDTEDGKIDYTLVYDGPMLDRYAAHLTKGAAKYSPRNWMLAASDPDPKEIRKVIERARRSAARHFRQWMRGDNDEDHAAAVIFNLNVAEHLIPVAEAKEAEA